MNKRLLSLGGILNGVFTLFHVWLGWQIQQYPDLLPDYRALMQMLNVGGILMLAFATFTSLFCKGEVLASSLGRATLGLIALFYAARAAEEVVLASHFSPAIFGACLAVALLYGVLVASTLRRPGGKNE